MDSWPGWLGKVYLINLPSTVVPNTGPAPVGGAHIGIILNLLERTKAAPGAVAECGVFQGRTLVPAALYLKLAGVRKEVIGLDSFEGFGKAVEVDRAMAGQMTEYMAVGGFSDTSLQHVEEKLWLFGLDGEVRLVKGFFEDTLKTLEECAYSFVHLDCDLYESYKTCLEYFYPRMARGGIILLDEYHDPNWPGCDLAVDEFLAGKPEKPVATERDNYIKYYIEKL